MKNTRILSIAVVLLLITNIALVAFMMTGNNKKTQSGRKQGSRTEAPKEMVEQLKMTEQQQQDFKALKEEHHKNTKPLMDSLWAAKKAFFGLARNPNTNDSLIDLYSIRVCERQAELDKMTLNHFRQVRNVFTPEQQPGYDSLVQKMMQRNKRDSAKKK